MCRTVPTLTITESKVINYTNLEHLARKKFLKHLVQTICTKKKAKTFYAPSERNHFSELVK